MATEKWAAAAGSWTTAATGTIFNSLAVNNAILSDTQIDNATSALDTFMDVELVLASAAFVAPNYVGVYIYPLNSDNSTYGDGRFTSAASTATDAVPPQYYVGAVSFAATTSAKQGVITGIPILPIKFKL